MARTVLVTSPGFDPKDPETAGRLSDAGLLIRHAPRTENRTPDELIPLLADIVGVIASSDPFNARVLRHARDLKVIARTGVGTDNIDLAEARANHIVVI